MNIAILLLGSNLGKRHKILQAALLEIEKQLGQIIQKSKCYESESWGIKTHPLFLNQVIKLKTSLLPEILLQKLLGIEKSLGRKRNEKWGPRTIDLDILYYNDMIIKTINLIIPHPQIQNRRFTLLPLCDLIPEYIHPVFKKNQRELLKTCSDSLGVWVFKK